MGRRLLKELRLCAIDQVGHSGASYGLQEDGVVEQQAYVRSALQAGATATSEGPVRRGQGVHDHGI
jgi:hypothetical protein